MLQVSSASKLVKNSSMDNRKNNDRCLDKFIGFNSFKFLPFLIDNKKSKQVALFIQFQNKLYEI